MRSTRRAASSVALACLMLSGCSVSLGTGPASGSQSPVGGASGTAAPAGGTSGPIAVGAGPQKQYTVQQQPAAGSCHYRYEHGEPLEDLTCTPGAISPAVTPANPQSNIC